MSQDIQKVAQDAFSAMAIRKDLEGSRFINLLRCSSISQADTSPDGQKKINDIYAARQGMIWAGNDIYAEGVSGSQTFNRDDIRQILERKRTRNDFDKVVVFEYARATRGGIRHGNVVEDELRKAGIELLSSTEEIPDGPTGELIKCVKHFANQQQAQNISLAVARGLSQSLAANKRPAAGRTNFGLDRLYVGPDGSKRTLIRWEGDTQLRIDPNTMQVISSAVRPPTRRPRKNGEPRSNERRQLFKGYTKQPDEISLLVPGSAAAREVVCLMWRMYYLQDIGAHRIIKYLRDHQIEAPWRCNWSLTTVHNILWNPIYLGIEVRHRWTKSLYFKLGTERPIPVKVDQDQLQREGKVCVPILERPRDEWELVDKPELKDFLPPDVREAAMAHVMARYDEDKVARQQAKRTKRKNKHDGNAYILSHVLRSKQTGRRMRGDTSTRKLLSGRKVYRYYFDYGTASAAISGLPARRVPAEPLEEAVASAVFAVLADRKWIEERVAAFMATHQQPTIDVDQQRKALETEREQIMRRLKRIHKTSAHLTEEELEALVAEDNARVVAIRKELTALERLPDREAPTANEAVEAVTQRLSMLPADWQTLPKVEVKALLAEVIERLEIDLETLAVTMTLRLPQEMMERMPSSDAASVRVNFTTPWLLQPDTNSRNALTLEKIACTHDSKLKCHRCERLRQAA